MLLFTDSSRKWRRRVLALLIAAVAFYIWRAWQGDFAHGGSPVGQAYGYAAAGLVLLLIGYAARKRAYRSRLGTLEGWTQSHVYLGLLAVALVLLHSGFRFHDKVAVAALVAMALVALSGLVGAVLYTLVPRVLTEIGTDPDAGEIAAQIRQLQSSADRLVEGRSASLSKVRDLLERDIRPRFLAGWRILGRSQRAFREDRLRQMLAAVGSDEQPVLKRLVVLCRQASDLHRNLVSQQRFRNLLQAWLYLHVPLSAALVILIAAHLVAVYYYT